MNYELFFVPLHAQKVYAIHSLKVKDLMCLPLREQMENGKDPLIPFRGNKW